MYNCIDEYISSQEKFTTIEILYGSIQQNMYIFTLYVFLINFILEIENVILFSCITFTITELQNRYLQHVAYNHSDTRNTQSPIYRNTGINKELNSSPIGDCMHMSEAETHVFLQ